MSEKPPPVPQAAQDAPSPPVAEAAKTPAEVAAQRPAAKAQRPRQRRKAERPAEILTAALESFATRGFAATRMEDVAAAAGIGKGTLYLYYPTKDDLFRAVVRETITPQVLEGRHLADTSASATEALQALALRFHDLIDSPAAVLPKLIVAEAGNFPSLAAFYGSEVIARANETFEALRLRGVARGEFADPGPDVLMPVFVAPMLLLALWRHSLGPHSPLTLDAAAILRTHAELIIRGLTAGRDTE